MSQMFVSEPPVARSGGWRRRWRQAMAPLTAAVLMLLGPLTGVAPTASASVLVGSVVGWGYPAPPPASHVGIPASLASTGATAIAVGEDHRLAVTPAGKVVSWSQGYSRLNDVPPSLNDKTFTRVAAGRLHSLALTSDGKVFAWGGNGYGQTAVPASLNGRTVTAVAAGGWHSLALTSDGRVTAWGWNASGQTAVPASLNGKMVTAIAAGAAFSLALTSDGKVTVWGYEGTGNVRYAVPTSLDGKTVTAITAGDYHILALTSDGKVTGWGLNDYGEAGVPASLTGRTVTAVAAGEYHSLALTSDGRVTSWGGQSWYGQIFPPATLYDVKVTAIAAGGKFSLALTQGASPVVTRSPTSTKVEVGTKAYFEAGATGDPVPTVQWQRADDGGAFEDVLGATNTTFTFTTAATDDGATFRAVFTSRNGTATTAAATLSLNRPPSAANLNVTAKFESPTPITLTGTDPDGDTLTYAVESPPTHGTLSGTASALTYTPVTAYSGPDAFTYRVNDGGVSSAAATVSVTVATQSCIPPAPKRQFKVNRDELDTNGVIHSPKFKTKKTGELLVAFVTLNGPNPGTQAINEVSGGGLTWNLAQRDNESDGSTEIWQAYAPKKLKSTQISAYVATPGYSVTMTVVGFSGARPAVGAASHRFGAQSAPHVSLVPQASGSVVWAAGRVIGSSYGPVPASGQKIVHDQTFKSPKTGYWTQSITKATTSGTKVTVSDKATAETWGYTAVEIRGVCG